MKQLIYFSLLITFIISCERHDMDEAGNLVPKTVTEDPMLPQMDVNGVPLHLETFGDIHNPILILLHGGPGSDYRAMISQIGEENASRYPSKRQIPESGLSKLRESYFCVFYDQRGAGLSPRFDRGDLSFNQYVDDLDFIIDHFLDKKKSVTGINESQVYLFGWSFGGILSTGYINQYPHKVKDVVMYEPGPFTKEAWDYFKDNTTSVFEQVNEEWLGDYLMSNDHISPESHERADYHDLLGAFRANPQFHENPNCPLWRFGALMDGAKMDFSESDNYDIVSNLINFSGRMLFVGGGLTMDEYPNYLDMQTDLYPQSNSVIIPNVGHTGPWEEPNKLVQIITNFLQE